jgi:hypothetical protein
MRTKGRNTPSAVAAAAILAIVLGSQPVARAGSDTPPAGGPSEAIKVHGHWTIDILNPDGSLVSHHEFENALTNGFGASTFLNGVLSRSKRVGKWQVALGGSPACYPNNAPCWIVEPGTPIEGGVLSATTPTTGPNAGKFVLSGSTTAPRAAQISVVQTQTDDCPAAVGSTCTAGSFGFTQKVLTAPIDLAEGQIIQVTVVISFS